MNNLKFIANFNKKFSKFINNLIEKNLNKLNMAEKIEIIEKQKKITEKKKKKKKK